MVCQLIILKNQMNKVLSYDCTTNWDKDNYLFTVNMLTFNGMTISIRYF